jgi:hypothetical protein
MVRDAWGQLDVEFCPKTRCDTARRAWHHRFVQQIACSWFEPAGTVDTSMIASFELYLRAEPCLVAGIANGSIGGQAIEPCY